MPPENRCFADIDTERSMSFLQEKRETRFAGKPVTANQPRTAE